VFRTDQQARREGLSPPDRLLLHQQESAPRMQALEDWMASQFAEHTVEPHSGLGQAISHMQNHRQKLTPFLARAGHAHRQQHLRTYPQEGDPVLVAWAVAFEFRARK
ncbi:MAG: transposase, partial [Candidatus Accumulibacter sp.]|nr:transposase [Accumulibacter sp.]